MAENPTKGGVHHSAFLSRKTAPAAPSFHVRDAKVVKNRAENQPVNISSHSAKNRSPTLKSPRIPHVTGDCVRRRSNNLLGQFRKITTDFRRTFSHKIPLASQNHLFRQSLAVSVSAMQPCSASFNSLPLPREYNITNMTAAKRYESVWNAFLNELSHNPTATLTSFLKRCNVRQGRMKRWMENHGLSVKEAKKRLRDCQHDGIGDPMSPLSEDSGSLFLPMATDKPAPRSESCDILSGVSLTFPDGTQVNIKRGSAQAVMSFLKLYQREDLPCLD